ncbi:MAG: zinc-ribbon domain-containing protein, partial [Paracoccaceae bacterium]
MRLICPNCGAQYEVPNDVIPQDGRDVQCSSCGHTWFQKHPAEDAGLAEELEQPLPEPDWQDEEWPDATAEPEPHPEPAPQPGPEPEAPEAATAPEPGRRPLDPEVARLLREEAEQEARARAAEAAGGLESQPD